MRSAHLYIHHPRWHYVFKLLRGSDDIRDAEYSTFHGYEDEFDPAQIPDDCWAPVSDMPEATQDDAVQTINDARERGEVA